LRLFFCITIELTLPLASGRCQQLENGRFCFMISGNIPTSNPLLIPPGGGPAPLPGAVPRPPPPAGGNAVEAKQAPGPAKASTNPIGALVPTMVGPGGVAVPPTGPAPTKAP
jgi:hypothetical protein